MTLEPDTPPTVTSQVKIPVPARGLSTWTGLAALGDGAISSLSTGRLTLHGEAADQIKTYKVGAPVLTLSSRGTNFALAGKELELSLWDAERTFQETTTKRNKDDLAPGEIWRAKNVPHTSLQLRQPVHHLSSAFLSDSGIVTGTKSGSVRRYDTRQRKPVGDWKVAREGGVGCVVPSQLDEHTVFFADHSSLVGALDIRTGKLLYGVPGLAATAHHLASLPAGWSSGSQVTGLASISSDATLRVVGVTPTPDVIKGNWGNGKKASVMGSVGGVGVGTFVFTGYGSRVEEKPAKASKAGEEDEEEEDEDEDVDDDEEDEMWENMGVQEDDGESESDEEDEDEQPSKKQKTTS